MKEDRTYFMRRAAQERSAATQSKGKARLAHKLMADHYRELVDQPDAVPADEAARTP